MVKLRSAESAGKVILSRSSGQSWSAQFDAYFVPVHDRAWRDISISKNLVRFSNEISRSTTRYFFKISSPSRNSRFDGTNSRSRLEARDVEDTNLDLVSNHEIKKILISSRKKTRSLFIFFAEIFCAIISKHCFFHFHLAYM